jgi:hypothetical protein
VALIGLSLLAVIPTLDRLLPTGLTGPAIAIASGATEALDTARLATSVAGSLVLIAASHGGAVIAFRRREL